MATATETDTLKKDMADLRATLERLSRDVAGISDTITRDLKERATSKMESLKAGSEKLARDIGQKGRNSVAAVETSVQEHPIQSLLMAFGAGVVIAQLLRR